MKTIEDIEQIDPENPPIFTADGIKWKRCLESGLWPPCPNLHVILYGPDRETPLGGATVTVEMLEDMLEAAKLIRAHHEARRKAGIN